MIKTKLAKSVMATLLLFSLSSMSVFAANYYDFKFSGQITGNATHAGPVQADGKFNPYVNPDGTTNATTYVLTLPSSLTSVSSFRTNVTSGKKYFTYDQGFGGKDQPYRLTGYPSNIDYQAYVAAGTWKP